MQDALSHTTGLAHLDLSWLGVESHSIVEKDAVFDVVAYLPTVSGLRHGFHYNNYAYSVVGKVINDRTGLP